MATGQILVSWIGHADLAALCRDLPEAERAEIGAAVKLPAREAEANGPVKTAVDARDWSEIHLLSDYPAFVNRAYRRWLGRPVTLHAVTLTDPTDYAAVFAAANEVLGSVGSCAARTRAHLSILLSPGTPAMTVTWVLLGRSRYPAEFLQTFRGRLTVARIPDELFEEIVPDLIRDRDIALQHLATRNPSEVEGFEMLVGQSQALRLAVGRAQRAALRDVPVLLAGETGTGKEMFARAVHAASRRKGGPFEAINCAAIPRELLEAELFGHTKGAFTGADKDREGAFARANGGTLFLDEIGECDPLLQSKLLRVLQPPPGRGSCCREFRPVGSAKTQFSDVRVVAATNRDLQREVQANRFREDLYYRLAVITLRLPPLRERRSDIPLLAEGFMTAINADFAADEPGYRHKRISGSAQDFMKRFDWPGNVRQLYNTILQTAVMAVGEVIDRRDVSAAIGDVTADRASDVLEQPLGDGFDLDEYLNSIRRHYLRRAMQQANGNKTRAARLLGMKHYQTLDHQLDRLKVDWEGAEDQR